jgi:hypothetical protein
LGNTKEKQMETVHKLVHLCGMIVKVIWGGIWVLQAKLCGSVGVLWLSLVWLVAHSVEVIATWVDFGTQLGPWVSDVLLSVYSRWCPAW